MEQKITRFSNGEEIANAISHLTGTILAVAALVLMIIYSTIYGGAWHIVSTAVFGSTMVMLYLSSTLNHWLPVGRGKEFFFTFDQIAIFFMIAGTYTPLSLIALHGTTGWIIFGIEWGLALIGITTKLLHPTKFETGVNIFYIILYVIMGWLIVVVSVPVIKIISINGLVWVLIGGFCYSFGILFFKLTKLKYHHLIWHLFVIGGSASHFIAIFYYVIPIKIG